MSVDKRVSEACDEVDAMVFTGDGLHDVESLKFFRERMDRWNDEADRIQNAQEGKILKSDCNACEKCHLCPAVCKCNEDVKTCPNCGKARDE
jgi:hypothetical protein